MSILLKSYPPPPINEREALRYAGFFGDSKDVTARLHALIDECESLFTYKVCYGVYDFIIAEKAVVIEGVRFDSESLSESLASADKVVLFASSVGIKIDRLIARYSRISPSKALILQGLGSERVESLADTFCDEISRAENATPLRRFSPGYGDLPLSCQKNIISLLDTPRKIGVSLSDSLIMSPSKSITAFLGLKKR